jgi:ElaB/YqjD/DUF883 family membrane-anchored ribosome-binding protein
MDQTRTNDAAKEAAEQAGKTATDAAKRLGEQMQPALDQGKAVVQDLANRASEVGRQSMGRAGELADRVAPQARQVASNLYEQGSRSGQAVRQYASQEPFAAMLVAGLIGFTLGYLIRGATNQGDRAG